MNVVSKIFLNDPLINTLNTLPEPIKFLFSVTLHYCWKMEQSSIFPKGKKKKKKGQKNIDDENLVYTWRIQPM